MDTLTKPGTKMRRSSIRRGPYTSYWLDKPQCCDTIRTSMFHDSRISYAAMEICLGDAKGAAKDLLLSHGK
jgi:hypothetical protein